ncbi:PREDICTED: uncharacterized protein LOC106816666 [Priapulus caudatus]|uniref:Uncharacterized protein LOC106816666 n=1 Tax=Priapulus caudatus TaxID=37621 RepID=A0ABM1EX53_PRICU|nr:PREDICTED: uncharacterized protein LOC106816666 [Priapulus caudatus]
MQISIIWDVVLIGSCSGLTVLSLRGNRLRHVPQELGHVSQLRVVNLSENQLQSLPISLVKLKQLDALWLSDNQVLPNSEGHADVSTAIQETSPLQANIAADGKVREAKVTKPRSPTTQDRHERHLLYRFDKEKQARDKARMKKQGDTTAAAKPVKPINVKKPAPFSSNRGDGQEDIIYQRAEPVSPNSTANLVREARFIKYLGLGELKRMRNHRGAPPRASEHGYKSDHELYQRGERHPAMRAGYASDWEVAMLRRSGDPLAAGYLSDTDEARQQHVQQSYQPGFLPPVGVVGSMPEFISRPKPLGLDGRTLMTPDERDTDITDNIRRIQGNLMHFHDNKTYKSISEPAMLGEGPDAHSSPFPLRRGDGMESNAHDSASSKEKHVSAHDSADGGRRGKFANVPDIAMNVKPGIALCRTVHKSEWRRELERKEKERQIALLNPYHVNTGSEVTPPYPKLPPYRPLTSHKSASVSSGSSSESRRPPGLPISPRSKAQRARHSPARSSHRSPVGSPLASVSGHGEQRHFFSDEPMPRAPPCSSLDRSDSGGRKPWELSSAPMAGIARDLPDGKSVDLDSLSEIYVADDAGLTKHQHELTVRGPSVSSDGYSPRASVNSSVSQHNDSSQLSSGDPSPMPGRGGGGGGRGRSAGGQRAHDSSLSLSGELSPRRRSDGGRFSSASNSLNCSRDSSGQAAATTNRAAAASGQAFTATNWAVTGQAGAAAGHVSSSTNQVGRMATADDRTSRSPTRRAHQPGKLDASPSRRRSWTSLLTEDDATPSAKPNRPLRCPQGALTTVRSAFVPSTRGPPSRTTSSPLCAAPPSSPASNVNSPTVFASARRGDAEEAAQREVSTATPHNRIRAATDQDVQRYRSDENHNERKPNGQLVSANNNNNNNKNNVDRKSDIPFIDSSDESAGDGDARHQVVPPHAEENGKSQLDCHPGYREQWASSTVAPPPVPQSSSSLPATSFSSFHQVAPPLEPQYGGSGRSLPPMPPAHRSPPTVPPKPTHLQHTSYRGGCGGGSGCGGEGQAFLGPMLYQNDTYDDIDDYPSAAAGGGPQTGEASRRWSSRPQTADGGANAGPQGQPSGQRGQPSFSTAASHASAVLPPMQHDRAMHVLPSRHGEAGMPAGPADRQPTQNVAPAMGRSANQSTPHWNQRQMQMAPGFIAPQTHAVNGWSGHQATASKSENDLQWFQVLILKNPGLGFSICGGVDSVGNPFRPNDTGIFVTKVQTGGPADMILSCGDKILQLNSMDMTAVTHDEAVSRLKRSGPSVSLLIERLR